jgi:aryl-alcohol dehydrogenase (NADP+)
MDYANLGNTGLKVSSICLGCMSFGKGNFHSEWTLNSDESMPFFRRAFEAGINFVDTSDGYAEGQSELVVGRAIREFGRRENVVLATKFIASTGPGVNERGASRKHIMQAVEGSLKRLNTDYIDIYQQHAWDNGTPLEETLRALEDLVRTGKVLHIGASNYKAWQLAKALQIQALRGWTRFATMQVQYNLVYREEEREMIPLCQDQGLAVLAWSALARGFLAGNRQRDGGGETARAKADTVAKSIYFRNEDFALQAVLAGIAQKRGVSPMQVALAWFSSRPAGVVPIIGVTKLEQLEESIAATQLTLSDDERESLDAHYATRPVFSFQR